LTMAEHDPDRKVLPSRCKKIAGDFKITLPAT
jgi:hypothetical protein